MKHHFHLQNNMLEQIINECDAFYRQPPSFWVYIVLCVRCPWTMGKEQVYWEMPGTAKSCDEVSKGECIDMADSLVWHKSNVAHHNYIQRVKKILDKSVAWSSYLRPINTSVIRTWPFHANNNFLHPCTHVFIQNSGVWVTRGTDDYVPTSGSSICRLPLSNNRRFQSRKQTTKMEVVVGIGKLLSF